MDQGVNFHVAMESSLSKQTHMGYVPLACSRDACGAPLEKEVVAYATKGFVQNSEGFPPPPHDHHHIDKSTYLHDGVCKDG
jgi:hypothetical protein